jgi:hypothetical protein
MTLFVFFEAVDSEKTFMMLAKILLIGPKIWRIRFAFKDTPAFRCEGRLKTFDRFPAF